MSPKDAGANLEAGVSSEGDGTLPRVNFIPDFFVPIPRRGGQQALPLPGMRGTGQLEPD